MFSLVPQAELKFEADTYAALIRGGHPHLLLNAGLDGVRIIDCPAGKELGVVAFPESGFGIYTWLVSPDGSKSYLFSQDELDYAVEVDLEARKSRKIRLGKGFQVATELAWFTPAFHVLDYKDRVWRLEKDSLVPADVPATEQVYTKRFRKIIERFVVARMHAGKGLYVRTRNAPQLQIGYFSLADDKELLTPATGEEIDVAHFQNALFLAYDAEIVQHRAGKKEVVFTPDEDNAFLQVAAVGEGLLAVLSSTKDYLTGPVGTLNLYQLTERKATS